MMRPPIPAEVEAIILAARRDELLAREEALPPEPEGPHVFAKVDGATHVPCPYCKADLRGRPLDQDTDKVTCRCRLTMTVQCLAGLGGMLQVRTLSWPELLALQVLSDRLERLAREARGHNLRSFENMFLAYASARYIEPGTRRDLRFMLDLLVRDCVGNLAALRLAARGDIPGERAEYGPRRWVQARLYLAAALAGRAARRAIDCAGIPPELAHPIAIERTNGGLHAVEPSP